MMLKSRKPSDTSVSQRARRAHGQPISALMHQALANPDLISLAAGFVDQATLPAAETQEALEALFSDSDVARKALQYGTTPGYGPLREALLARMLRADGVKPDDCKITTDQVLLTAGSNQLLYLVCDSLLDPNDIVLCGSPSYFVLLSLIGNLGVCSVGVATDSDGIIPEALEEQLKRCKAAGDLPRVKAIYICTYFDNPTSLSLSAERRGQIVEIAKRWSRDSQSCAGDIYLIEDVAYRELRYYGDDIPSMRSFDSDGDTVVVAGTFSKSYSPGIRVGWGILPPKLVEPVSNQKGNFDFGSPNFSQHLMHLVLELGLFDRHVELIRKSYRMKLEAMLQAADTFLAPIEGIRWARPQGGLYVWLELPGHIDAGPSGKLFNRAVEQGVLYVPGGYCFAKQGEAPRENVIRLSFGVQTPENIRRGVEALAKAIGEL